MAVFPADVIVGDQEGVVVIPLHLAENILQEASEMTAFEDFVTEQVNSGEAIIGLYPATSAKAEADYVVWWGKTGR